MVRVSSDPSLHHSRLSCPSFPLSTYLVCICLSVFEIPAWLFLILCPSSQITKSGPGSSRATCMSTTHQATLFSNRSVPHTEASYIKITNMARKAPRRHGDAIVFWIHIKGLSSHGKCSCSTIAKVHRVTLPLYIYVLVCLHHRGVMNLDLHPRDTLISVRGMQVPWRYTDHCQGYAGTLKIHLSLSGVCRYPGDTLNSVSAMQVPWRYLEQCQGYADTLNSVRGMQVPWRYTDHCQGYAGTLEIP